MLGEVEGAGVQITITLRGMLRDHLPPGSGRHPRPLEVAEDSTIESVLEHLAVPLELAHLVLLNGEHVPAPRLRATPLHAKDTLAVWPPLSGG